MELGGGERWWRKAVALVCTSGLESFKTITRTHLLACPRKEGEDIEWVKLTNEGRKGRRCGDGHRLVRGSSDELEKIWKVLSLLWVLKWKRRGREKGERG